METKNRETYSASRQNNLLCSRDGVLDSGSIDEHAGSSLAVVQNYLFDPCLLIEIEVRRLPKGLT